MHLLITDLKFEFPQHLFAYFQFIYFLLNTISNKKNATVESLQVVTC